MLTFEEWRHTYADVFETDDAARAAWTAACNRGYRTGMQDTRALLAAHNAGAQGEPVGTAVNDEELGRFWEMHKPASEFPVGTHVYAYPQPQTQTDAAREPVAEIVRWLDFTNKPRFDIKIIDKTIEHGTKLYTRPQPMPQGELPSCDVERMRAAFESARPAVKKFHYQWDTRRQRYLLDGDEDRGQYMQNEFAEWCEAWCAAIAARPMPQTDAARDAAYAKLRQPFARLPYEALTSIRLEEDWSDARERLAYARRVAEAAIRSCEIQLQQRIIEIERLDGAKGE